MDATKKIAFDRGLALLKASGAQYKVVDADGVEYGDLNCRILKSPPRPGAPGKSKKSGLLYLPLYKEKMDAMPPGTAYTISLPEGEGWSLNSLQGSIASYGNRLWGKESYITKKDVTAKTVEILRVI